MVRPSKLPAGAFAYSFMAAAPNSAHEASDGEPTIRMGDCWVVTFSSVTGTSVWTPQR
jgi:hypothetical protein